MLFQRPPTCLNLTLLPNSAVLPDGMTDSSCLWTLRNHTIGFAWWPVTAMRTTAMPAHKDDAADNIGARWEDSDYHGWLTAPRDDPGRHSKQISQRSPSTRCRRQFRTGPSVTNGKGLQQALENIAMKSESLQLQATSHQFRVIRPHQQSPRYRSWHYPSWNKIKICSDVCISAWLPSGCLLDAL